jgi:hypothetical protein
MVLPFSLSLLNFSTVQQLFSYSSVNEREKIVVLINSLEINTNKLHIIIKTHQNQMKNKLSMDK